MDARARAVLDFWIGEVGPKGWYAPDEAIDRAITDRFGALWSDGRARRLEGWRCAAESSLALVILLDQFPRNMFRGSAEAFATDGQALAAAKAAIDHGFDERVALPERQFFYMPLMHSEMLADQDRSVRLFVMNFGEGESLAHARAHREIIRRFGRFPYRNAALGRRSRPEEQAFLDAGGYAAMVEEIGA